MSFVDVNRQARLAGFTNQEEYNDCMASIDTRGKVYKFDGPYEDMQIMNPEKKQQREAEHKRRLMNDIFGFMS